MTLTKLGDRDREDADVEDIASKALAGLGTQKLSAEAKAAKAAADARLKAKYDHDLNRLHRDFVENGDLEVMQGRAERAIRDSDPMLLRAILREGWTKGFRQGFNRGRLLTDV